MAGIPLLRTAKSFEQNCRLAKSSRKNLPIEALCEVEGFFVY